ncbi:hypothetical protein AYO45_03080 [Gammaproteobacteria bacterium SCGC AG-212-F23]|nr:hypothetical protein AYO45_03080 [Gammaproteobacteria bacterium SCGC AG-212-F23]
MQTYLFYDLETTGLNKSFDQILHFAAIRTDLNLNELNRYELIIKLNTDVIPAPQAMITHHMSLSDIASGISEWDAIQQIHQWMNQPGTISLGYNTLGFDDEFLRFSFYRNLLPPYTHQYANQCGRMDLYPMAILYFLFKNSVIRWPNQSLKLENINKENNFISGRSHHAMVDVEVTLALAKCFQRDKDMWDYVTAYFNKKEDQKRSQLSTGLMILGRIGAEKFFQAPVLFLGNHKHYTNQTVWLRLDNELFNESTAVEKTFSMFKKLGEPGFLLPFNNRFLQHLSSERLEITEANQQWLKTHEDFFQALENFHCDYKYPTYPDTDASARLYLNAFPTPMEEQFCRQFHTATPPEKSKLIDNVQNETLRTLAIRILGRHFPEALSSQQKDSFEKYLSQIKSESTTIIDFKGEKHSTPAAALQQLSAIQNPTDEQKTILTQMEKFYNSLI